VGKHRSNLQYFKGKKLQREIFNQLNIKKIKLTKRLLGKKKRGGGSKLFFEKVTKKNEKKKKKGKKERKRNTLWITVVIHSVFGWVNSKFPTPFSLLLN